jgi:NAD+ synthase (glutamine-hydrolysing)
VLIALLHHVYFQSSDEFDHGGLIRESGKDPGFLKKSPGGAGLDQDYFVEMNIRTLRILQRDLPRGITVGKALVNMYGIVLDGCLVFKQVKTLLPIYYVFDEARNFEIPRQWSVFEWKGERIGVAICEDVWRETEIPGTSYLKNPVRQFLYQGISIHSVPSASPYVTGKLKICRALVERTSHRGYLLLIYSNALGPGSR